MSGQVLVDLDIPRLVVYLRTEVVLDGLDIAQSLIAFGCIALLVHFQNPTPLIYPRRQDVMNALQEGTLLSSLPHHKFVRHDGHSWRTNRFNSVRVRVPIRLGTAEVVPARGSAG